MFDEQCWWITGASSGIGEGLARALAARRASLILSGRNVAALDAVARDCADALVLPFEATDFDLIPGIVERAWSWKGRIDGLVNNAGISQRSLVLTCIINRYMIYSWVGGKNYAQGLPHSTLLGEGSSAD